MYMFIKDRMYSLSKFLTLVGCHFLPTLFSFTSTLTHSLAVSFRQQPKLKAYMTIYTFNLRYSYYLSIFFENGFSVIYGQGKVQIETKLNGRPDTGL